MVTSTNYTEYGIHSTGERCLWVTWLMIVLLSSLIGDSIILIASVKYNAIKLNKFLVVIMQHIAVCDILAAITYVLPTIISLIANKWVLGDALAYAQVYFHSSAFSGSNILICVLSCSKLLLLKFPLQIRTSHVLTKKCAHVTCGSVWLLSFILPGVRWAFDENGLVFSFIEYNINYGLPAEQISKANLVIMYTIYAVTVFIPTFIVVLTTFGLVTFLLKSRRVAKRTGTDQRWQGIVTVVATAVVYCVSIIPGAVTLFLKAPNNAILRDRIFETLVTLNVMCNFYIYILTVPSFRNFIRLKAFQISRRLARCIGFSSGLQAVMSMGEEQNVIENHLVDTIQTSEML